MFSALKRNTTVSIIVSAVNAVFSLLMYLYISAHIEASFPIRLAIYVFLFTIPILFILNTLNQRRIVQELEDETVERLEDISELKKQVNDLEFKITH